MTTEETTPPERSRPRPAGRHDATREGTIMSQVLDTALTPPLQPVQDIQSMTHVLLPGAVWAEIVQLLSQLPYGQVKDLMRRIEGGSEWYRKAESDIPQG